MKVLKFGGTSVGSAERIKSLTPIITGSSPCVVVLSAMSGTTNALMAIVESSKKCEMTKTLNQTEALRFKYMETIDSLYTSKNGKEEAEKEVDKHFDKIFNILKEGIDQVKADTIVSMGERISTFLLHKYLLEIGLQSALLPALEFMRTDKDEEPDTYHIAHNLKSLMDQADFCPIFITQGFICRNFRGDISNFGRGGSDYSAAIIGAALDASEVQIWTDIDGLHNNDPRFVSYTAPIRNLSYDEAAELAYFGAKILHPSTVLPCKEKQIPVVLKNTLNPHDVGTTINAEYHPNGIKATAAKEDIVAIKVKSSHMLLAYGFLNRIFEIFSQYHTPVDMLATSEVSVSITIDGCHHLEEILAELSKFACVEVDYNQTIICVVGDFSASSRGYATRIFNTLDNIPIRMISYGGSNNSVSFLIDSCHKSKALQALNTIINEQKTTPCTAY